ncbi:6-bladed beta-propeller [Maribellus maritimus]|nr:6-bladed beta-propeller [Maribellus maritimus]
MIMLLYSCVDKGNKESNIDFSMQKLSESTFSETISNYSIVKLETAEESKINVITKVLINNEHIYVLNHWENRQEILIFSQAGDYIDKISSGNNSTKSFSGIIDFDIHPVTGDICLLDQKQKKLVFFKEDGRFVKSTPINYLAGEIAYGVKAGKVFVVLHTIQSDAESDINDEIIVYDENDKLLDTYFEYQKENQPLQNKRITLMKRGDNVMFLKEGTNTLYEIGLKKCDIKSTFTFPKPVLPVNKIYGAFFSGDVDVSQYVYDIDYFESDSILYTTFSSTDGDYIGIFNKETNCSTLYNMLLDPSCKCGIKIEIAGVYQNNFIVQIPRTKIADVLEVLDNGRTKCTNDEIFELIDNMKPGENPILLLLELK